MSVSTCSISILVCALQTRVYNAISSILNNVVVYFQRAIDCDRCDITIGIPYLDVFSVFDQDVPDLTVDITVMAVPFRDLTEATSINVQRIRGQ